MSKRKKKKFQKKQLVSLFENGNYQKVISKVKQFEIDGLSENELNDIVSTSYKNLAQLNFEQGDISRAIRDIDSLLQRNDEIEFRLIKLKYLCYIEHFEEAILLGKELIVLKNKKIQKDAIFLYLMAKLYGGHYELESKLLKAIPVSKQRYILGFKALLEDDKQQALDYFNQCNPRAKVEKENIKAVIATVVHQDIDITQYIKPLYRFLLTGEESGVSNSKNFRVIKKELKKNFSKVKKDIHIQNLLELKTYVPIDVILKSAENREQESRLIYNNIVLLVDKRKHREALKIFLKYRNSLVKFIESASLFIKIKNRIGERTNDSILVHFFSSYLKLHHKKIAPHEIDYIVLFLIQQNEIKKSMDLAKEYNRDNFIFFLKELPLIREFNPYYQTSFNKALKKYSTFTNILLDLMIENIESMDEELHDLSPEEEKMFIYRLSLIILLLQNLENPHRKYKDTLFKLFKTFALLIQNFSYAEQESIYLKLSIVIEKYIEYLKVDRFDLAVDIKALFVSISKKESVKKTDISVDNEDDYFALARKIFLEEEEDEDIYDFDIKEYDISIIKQRCLSALESGEESPFEALNKLSEFKYSKFRFSTLLGLLTEVLRLKENHLSAIQHMLFYLRIDLYNSSARDDLVSAINRYAKIDIETARLLLKYALDSVASISREYVWYLKWIDGYLTLINQYKLEKDSKYRYYRDLFLTIQERKKFKSLNAKYKKIKKRKGRE
jgi:hypothetical protein